VVHEFAAVWPARELRRQRKVMNLIFFGPPGAGKGTQAQLLAAGLAIPQVSTGEILRAAIRAGTPLGKQVEPILASGKLVPDGLVIEIVAERLVQKDALSGFILDGFPRTIPQAEALGKALTSQGRKIDHVVSLEVPEAILLQRITSRAASSAEKRSDDTEEVARKRLAAYHAETQPLKAYFQQQNLLRLVDGTQSVDNVAAAIRALLK
jgi:adenylate kinase